MKFALVAAATLMTAMMATHTEAAEKTLKIGYSDALTGAGAVYGIPQKQAVELAIGQINAAGGVKVGKDDYKLELVVYDDKGDSTEASNVARKLIDRDGVKYLMGYCCSATGGAVASFIGREDVIMLVGTAGARAITAAGNPNVFRTRPPGDYTGAAAGRFIYQQGYKRLGVLTTRDVALFTQYRDAMLDAYKKAGGTVVAVETFGGQDRDMSAQLTKIRSLKPDALFISGYVEQAAFAHRQARELGINVPRFGFSGGSAEQFLRVISSKQMDGAWDLLAVEFNADILGPKAKAYDALYRKTYKAPPTPNSAYAYDQVWVLKHALEKAGTVDDLETVEKALHQLPIPQEALLKYIPIDGKMFDAKGQAYISNGAFKWVDGKWVYQQELPSDAAAYSKYLQSVKN